MDAEQLKKISDQVTSKTSLEAVLLEKIQNIPASSLVKAKDYKPNKNIPKDYIDSIEDSAKRQQIRHRDTLLRIVGFLATASFTMLAVVVILQLITILLGYTIAINIRKFIR